MVACSCRTTRKLMLPSRASRGAREACSPVVNDRFPQARPAPPRASIANAAFGTQRRRKCDNLSQRRAAGHTQALAPSAGLTRLSCAVAGQNGLSPSEARKVVPAVLFCRVLTIQDGQHQDRPGSALLAAHLALHEFGPRT